jgi:hypothetical protein
MTAMVIESAPGDILDFNEDNQCAGDADQRAEVCGNQEGTSTLSLDVQSFSRTRNLEDDVSTGRGASASHPCRIS